MALSNPEKEDKEMKHKVSKHFLSALLAFVMIIGLVPTSVLAAPTLSGNGGDAWNIQLSDDGVLT